MFNVFTPTTIEALKRLIRDGPAGNRWFKANLHIHGEKNDPGEVVSAARAAEIDLIAITDHQSFGSFDAIAAAADRPGRTLTVLPGIELTSIEGVHILGIFPVSYSADSRRGLLGWLEIPGSGDTRVASTQKLAEILQKIEQEGGLTITPHPFSQGMGLLDSARKISTKEEWLESGHIRLMQISDWEKVKYVDRDEGGNWINRYVLASASAAHVRDSNYCLAPFNRSDAHGPSEIADGCSWFWMAEPSIEGLKQVACEPKARISLNEPSPAHNNAILGMQISGGYSDGEFFTFSDALNCIVGQNYAGKSAVLDFLRFGLGVEGEVDDSLRQNLLSRLTGILTNGGVVEVYVRQLDEFYAIRRAFNPTAVGEGAGLCCNDPPCAYRYDQAQDSLIKIEGFKFPVEVYEQHRISRLRDDVTRQLEMLDEFAEIAPLKERRLKAINSLHESARTLGPLYEECDLLRSEVGNLSQFEQELAEKATLISSDEEQAWANSVNIVRRLKDVAEELVRIGGSLPDPNVPQLKRETQLQQLFGQNLPAVGQEPTVHPGIALDLNEAIQTALGQIERARETIATAIAKMQETILPIEKDWSEKRRNHEEVVRSKLRAAGVESPQEIIDRVGFLRDQLDNIRTKLQPRLAEICGLIDQHETTRAALLVQLETSNAEIATKRREKAADLTESVGGQIRISVNSSADVSEYTSVLDRLCAEIATKESRIQNREGQLSRVVSQLSPIRLARALSAKGTVMLDGGATTTLQSLCGITENTENFLCRIADNIMTLDKLQTVETPDIPEIRVQRRGESTFADLRTGLSPGEQSAAILTLALQTRSMPLILDQPEDELGYSYVVHLIVPKILQAKFSRQILIVTHNANIPVLGDADYVTKMENRPRESSGRACVVAERGCFESVNITNALVELEGGQRAFEFRQHRYAVPTGKH